MCRFVAIVVSVLGLSCWSSGIVKAQQPSADDAKAIETGLGELQKAVAELRQKKKGDRLIADVEVYAKGVEWALRHSEFYLPAPPKDGSKPKTEPKSKYPQFALNAIKTGLRRAAELASGQPSWVRQSGKSIRGYVSKVDGSVQPYAVTLPAGIDPTGSQRWPLYVVLHGRGGDRNEIRFIDEHDGKPWPKDPPLSATDWVQVDVFGRTDNAYRWAGETDVFEAIADVKRRYRIDDRRIVLWGFSMGGAGSWHLGVHHPDKWCSVGPGAGFVDFYKYQGKKDPLPAPQHEGLRIYDALDYALNAYNVPICTYGGELDKQLAASLNMVEAAKSQDVAIKMLIGPKTEHKFHPESFKEFMAFHRENAKLGRLSAQQRREIRFVTYTLKYNVCDWLTVEEMSDHLDAATVHAVAGNDGVLHIKTDNVTALQIDRDVAQTVEIDGDSHPLSNAGGGLLPGVFYVWNGQHWDLLDYEQSRAFANNPELHKRHNLQGPIDDAFMEPFVCVLPSDKPWTESQGLWTQWTYDRFAREFDKWFRGRVPTIKDTELTDELIADKNLILFGDPGSNRVLAKVLSDLPVKWSKDAIEVNGKKFDPSAHGLSLIFPNPLNPNRYVVINSGHTMHDAEFKGTNALLFPRLGDIAIQKLEKQKDGNFTESVQWADYFDTEWKLPKKSSPAPCGANGPQ